MIVMIVDKSALHGHFFLSFYYLRVYAMITPR